MHVDTIVAIRHDGELVCEDCLENPEERSVFYDLPDSLECAVNDGNLFPVFAQDVQDSDICDRCHKKLLD